MDEEFKIPGLPITPPKLPEVPKPELPPEVTKLRPDILQTFLLDEISGRLQELSEIVDRFGKLVERIEQGMEKVPQGIMVPYDVSIQGTKLYRLDIFEISESEWFSCSVVNDEDSSDSIDVAINDHRRGFRRLRPSEALEVDFHAPKLRYIFLKCATASGSATVHIVGEL